MKQCKVCGSYAINENCHDRVKGELLDLCDVCYWHEKYNRLLETVKEDETIKTFLLKFYSDNETVDIKDYEDKLITFISDLNNES